MDTTLNAEPRTNTGKGAARKLRAAGKVPAVVYADGDAATEVEIDPARLDEIFRKSRNRNTVVQLKLGDAEVPVLVQEAQRHPVSRQFLHVDFLKVGADKPVEVMVPVVAAGRPAAAVLGGRIRIIRRELKVRCTYDRIPETLDVDVSPMEIGDIVKASEVPTPEGVSLVFETDFNVLTCFGKKGGNK
ncbi:MAG: 50S ribosomal protein L25 [Alphaproteobacteria bacterium]|nr:50S ribosomal protein L25 [Alphaproteobacteria bacterium]